MGLIVLEGVDGAGKTTLAHELIDQYQGPVLYVHHGVGDSTYDQIGREMEDAWIHPDRLTIYDRWWQSELVYAPVYRAEMPPTVNDIAVHIRYGDMLRAFGLLVYLPPRLSSESELLTSSEARLVKGYGHLIRKGDKSTEMREQGRKGTPYPQWTLWQDPEVRAGEPACSVRTLVDNAMAKHYKAWTNPENALSFGPLCH